MEYSAEITTETDVRRKAGQCLVAASAGAVIGGVEGTSIGDIRMTKEFANRCESTPSAAAGVQMHPD